MNRDISFSVIRPFICFVAVFATMVTSLRAAPPTVTALFPAGMKRGMTIEVTASGTFDNWPVKVWTDCSGLNFLAETNSGKFLVQIAKDAPLGPHLLRVFNQDGASIPRLFVITREKDMEEKEPNDSFKQAQPIEKLCG